MQATERIRMSRRMRILVALTIGVFIVLFARITWVQLIVGPAVTQRAEQSWRREIPVMAPRGTIVDRSGIPLVTTMSAPSVYVIPAQITDRKTTARRLADALGTTEQALLPLLQRKTMLVRVQPYGRKITMEQAQKVRMAHIPGVIVTEDYRRYAPYGSLAAHVLGVTGIDQQGLTGIEAKYESVLRGQPGHIDYVSDARGRVMPGTSWAQTPSLPGQQVTLTIDLAIQTIVERELDVAMASVRPRRVLAVAVNPKDGAVLAMASRPTFDPARYREVPVSVYNRNLPIWMTYEPGSTFKIITLAAALEEQKIDFTETFVDRGSVEVGGVTLHCWKRGGHGVQTFLEVVQNSCNPGFVLMGQRLGKETLFRYIRAFGFGRKTGIDLAGEENGILFAEQRVGPVELATTAFGQGVSVTPIQQVMAVAAAINGGTLFAPRVTESWKDSVTGAIIRRFPPRIIKRNIISPATSSAIREALESVVALGTGRQAFVEGYRVGGKTGTAQIVVNGKYSATEHIVSFIGFAPADDPQLLIYVAVDNPEGIQFGGRIAAPIVGRMMKDALHVMNVAPRADAIEKKDQWGIDVPKVIVPDMVGATQADIYERMGVAVRLVHYGQGNRIVWQLPQAGVRVPEGSAVQVYWANR